MSLEPYLTFILYIVSLLIISHRVILVQGLADVVAVLTEAEAVLADH
jgi:ABC-type branched-subunit amino acid transport system ATPase component